MISTLALLATGIMTGAAIYALVVEQPARLRCPMGCAIQQWRSSRKRAIVLQGPLAIGGSLLASAAWLVNGNQLWLVAGCLLWLVVAFTLLVVRRTSEELQDPDLDPASETTRDLLIRWGQYHAVRTSISLVALVLMLFNHA